MLTGHLPTMGHWYYSVFSFTNASSVQYVSFIHPGQLNLHAARLVLLKPWIITSASAETIYPIFIFPETFGSRTISKDISRGQRMNGLPQEIDFYRRLSLPATSRNGIHDRPTIKIIFLEMAGNIHHPWKWRTFRGDRERPIHPWKLIFMNCWCFKLPMEMAPS